MIVMMIDDYLSSYDVSAKYQAVVRAPAGHVYEAARCMDLSGSLTVRLLFRLRELPTIFQSRRSRQGLGLTLDDLLRAGFILLGEDRPREILLGVVGRFWASSGCIQKLDADGFRLFDAKGYAKAAWNFSISERGPGLCGLATETRIRCLDEESLRRFRLYWTLVGPFSGVIRKATLRAVKRQAESSRSLLQSSEKNQ
ncbi:MAG TPA: hypothetical protein VF762_23190 [Blastocatellia bacterium]